MTIGMKMTNGMMTGHSIQTHPVGPGTRKQKHGARPKPDRTKIWTMKNVFNSPGKVKQTLSNLMIGRFREEC